MLAIEFPSLILVEYRPSWPKYFQTGQISNFQNSENTNQGLNFSQLGRYSTKIAAEIQLRAFDRF
jgi:hypothetical protein